LSFYLSCSITRQSGGERIANIHSHAHTREAHARARFFVLRLAMAGLRSKTSFASHDILFFFPFIFGCDQRGQ